MISELQREVELYADVSEKWRADRDDVKATYSFIMLLGKAASVFNLLVGAEEQWRVRLARGLEQYSEAKYAFYMDLIRQWLGACEGLPETLAEFERAGFHVRQARRFRRCLREAKGILTPDDEFFADDRLVEERDRAIDEARRTA